MHIWNENYYAAKNGTIKIERLERFRRMVFTTPRRDTPRPSTLPQVPLQLKKLDHLIGLFEFVPRILVAAIAVSTMVAATAYVRNKIQNFPQRHFGI